MAHFTNTAADDIDYDEDVLYDVSDSSLWDLSADVGTECDRDLWFDLNANDSYTAYDCNKTDKCTERPSDSENTLSHSAGLTSGSECMLVSDRLQRNMSKNAILARENREKKKRYIHGLEKAVHDLSVKNKKLVHGCTTMRSTIAGLRREVNYLRGVIQNQSQLARLLKHVSVAGPTQHLQVNADHSVCDDESETRKASGSNNCQSFSASREPSESMLLELMPVAANKSLLTEHDYAQSARQNRNMSRHQFGVCLHVANDVTSLQLCAECSENAQ